MATYNEDIKLITPPERRRSDRLSLAFLLTLALIAPFTITSFSSTSPLFRHAGDKFRAHQITTSVAAEAWKESVKSCERLHRLPGPPSAFGERTVSDRFVKGTSPVLVRNATIWTGEDRGYELLQNTDVILDGGLISFVGPDLSLDTLPTDTRVYDAHGAFLTPGIFDMHSHIGVYPSPELKGASDGNSVAGPILPHLRSLDSLNTHDASYRRSISGGVTSALILPGSATNLGGQAFVIKLRETIEKTPDSKVLELPYHIPSPGQVEWKAGDPPRWRHMKMACGENIRRVFKQVRMDLAWNFRSNFEQARLLKVKQDDYCEKALAANSKGAALPDTFPDDLQLEALVDVLRGKAVDFADFIRHSNEFKIPIAAFHHAHEAWMVPDLIKSAWNQTPAVAIFATNARYKRESWRGTEYAAKILSENNITVIMKSDHPVLDSRYLAFEAQQAHHFGLAEHLAIASITTNPARAAGFGHRLGLIRPGYDADIVLWDSHPLSLGATPLQVWIDGISQLSHPYHAKLEPKSSNSPPIASVPDSPITLRDDFDEEEREWSTPVAKTTLNDIVFTNVSEVLLRRSGSAGLTELGDDISAPFDVRIQDGAIVCVGSCPASTSEATINLQGGSLLPPLVAFGPALGLTEIIAEPATTDAEVYDPLFSGELSRTQQLWGPTIAVRAIDGLELGGKHLKIAKESGILKAVTAPLGEGFFRGVSVAFKIDAENVLEPGAIIKEVVALHVTIGHFKLTQRASVSTQIAELRRLLLGIRKGDSVDDDASLEYFALAGQGEIPLVINAWKADTIASSILLKREVEVRSKKPLKFIIHGGQEAHLVADALAEAQISVILSPPRAFPETWDERRALPGPPLSPRSAANVLHNAGVRVALGVPEEWQARTLLWEAAWIARNSNDEISRKDAVSWLSSNLEDILGLPVDDVGKDEFVAYERDPFEFGSRMVASSYGGKIEVHH